MILETIQSYLNEHLPKKAHHYQDSLSALDMRPLSDQWKNFPLTATLSSDLLPLFPTQSASVDVRLLSLHIPRQKDVTTVVFFNGQHVPELSDTVQGLTVVEEPVIEKETYVHVGDLISHVTALPVLLHVDSSYSAEKPIRIIKCFQAVGADLAVPAVLTVAVEPGVAVQIIEETVVTGEMKVLDFQTTEYRIYESASLHVTRVQSAEERYSAITSTHAKVGRDGRYVLSLVGIGGEAERHDCYVELGEASSGEIYAAFAPRNKQVRNIHTRVVHTSPNTNSSQLVRSVPFDYAKTTFDAMIHVYQDAQKVDASFYGKTLMMSDNAKSFVYPKLEIYADDVKCAHGASVGHVIPEHMEYMRSRGIGEMRAKSLLAFAFLQEVYDTIPHEWLRKRLLNELETLFYLS